VKPQHELATSTCSGTKPFCAWVRSGVFAFIGDRRKYQTNLRTGSDHSSSNLTVDRSPDAALALSSHQTPFKTHSSQ
jgi:hypothetical protein